MKIDEILVMKDVKERHIKLAEYMLERDLMFLNQSLNEETNVYKKMKINAEIEEKKKDYKNFVELIEKTNIVD